MIRVLAFWLMIVSATILWLILREEKLAAKGRVPLGRLRQLWFRSERRRAPRYRLDWTVRYKRASTMNGNSQDGKTRDVSRTGAALILAERLEPGISIELEMSKPGTSEPMSIGGKVVWVRQMPQKETLPAQERLFLTGIQFYDMALPTQDLLEKELGPNEP